MSELERLMPVSYRRLLELQQLVEAYGRGDGSVMNQIIGLQVRKYFENVMLDTDYIKGSLSSCLANVLLT